MEAEALEAIWGMEFEMLNDSQPFKWSVKLMPVDCGGDEEEEEKQNHVVIKLIATIPLDYPEASVPELDVEVIKGLAGDQVKDLKAVANEEAEANAGMPAIFAVCEAVRAWLAENNVKGLDDGSMHAQMMRKMKEKEKAKVCGKTSVSMMRGAVTTYMSICVLFSQAAQVSMLPFSSCNERMLVKDLQYE